MGKWVCNVISFLILMNLCLQFLPGKRWYPYVRFFLQILFLFLLAEPFFAGKQEQLWDSAQKAAEEQLDGDWIKEWEDACEQMQQVKKEEEEQADVKVSQVVP